MERKKFLKQNSQNKWQKRGLEDNYFKLPFSQNILPKILRIFAKNVECAHRLRLIVVDKEKIDEKGMGDIEGVKGTFFTAGQFQIIFGTGHVNRVYEEVTKLGINETTESEAKEAKMDGKNRLQKAIRTFGDVFVPVIPALV